MPFRSIGIDIGHRTVRAVALERTRSGWKIAASASVPRCDSAGQPRPVGAVVGEIDNLVGLGRAPVTVADSAHSILVRFVATIPMPADRLAKLLRLELSQHADQTGEMAGDSFAVPLDGDEVIHACALGQPPELHGFLAELGRAGVTPRRIHVGAAALYNATILAPPVTGTDLALVVDIGESTTRVAMIGDGRLLGFRQLSIGGQVFTEALAQSRGIDAAKAEQLKTHWAAAQTSIPDSAILPVEPAAQVAAEAPAIAPPDLSNLPGFLDGTPSVAPVVPASPGRTAEPGFDDMLEEGLEAPGRQTMALGGATLGPEMTRAAEALHVQLFNTINWFRAQLQRDKLAVSRVLVGGGGAAMLGLEAYLARRLAVPVERFNPAAGLEGGPLDDAHEMAGAIGLAMSEHAEAVRLDLLPETIAQRRLWHERLVWPYVAAAAVLVATVVYLGGEWHNHWVRTKDADAAESLKSEVKTHYDEFIKLKADREKLGSDLNAIVSRLTFNRDFLYVIRLLKERAPEYHELWLTKLSATLQEDPIKSPLANGTTRPLRGEAGKAQVRLPRGDMEVQGRFKFSKASDSENLSRDFNRYLAALEGAKTPEGVGGTSAALFDPNLTVVLDKDELAGRLGLEKDGKDKGVFPFGFKLTFTPISLEAASKPKGKP